MNREATRSRADTGRALTVGMGFVVALCTAITGWAYRLPPIPSDQLYYFTFAEVFPAIPEDLPEFYPRFLHQYLRYGLTIPLRAAQDLLGYSQAAYLLVPLGFGVLLATSVYVLGTLLANRTVGVAGAGFTIGNSLIFPELTQPLPDLPATALFAAAVTVTVAVRQRRALVTATPRREALALVAIGILLAWSYLAREYIVFVWLLIPLLLIRRVPLLRWLWIVLPGAALVAGEAIVNAWIFGDPLARFHAASVHGRALPPITMDYIGQSRPWYLTRLLVLLYEQPEGIVLLACLGLVVVGALVSRTVAMFAVWAALFYVPLVTLGGLTDPEHPMLRILKHRYWTPLIPAITLGAVVAVWLAVRAVLRRIPFSARADGVAGVIVLALACVPVAMAHDVRMSDRSDPENLMYAANGGTQFEEFRTWLADHGDGIRTIWADQRSVRVLKVFVNKPFGGPVWKGDVKTWYPPDDARRSEIGVPQPGEHVLLYSARSHGCNLCRVNIQRLLDRRPVRAPASWRVVFATDDGLVELYEVG